MRNLEKVKEYFKDVIENAHDIDEFLGRLYSALQEETRYQIPLENYGYTLLSDQFDYLLEEGFEFENEYDLASEIFNYARMDGTLTYNTMHAEMELISNYGLDDISEMEMFEYCNNAEQMHIEACEETFRNDFSDYLENTNINFPDLSERERILLACYAISNDKELDLGIDLNNKFCKETLLKANKINKEELETFIKPEIIKELNSPNKNKDIDKGISR